MPTSEKNQGKKDGQLGSRENITEAPVVLRHCPKCGSVRVQRSRRRGVLEPVLASLGAEISRCQDCRCRQAWFGLTPLGLRGKDRDAIDWVGALFTVGCLACVALVWWVITQYSGLSG